MNCTFHTLAALAAVAVTTLAAGSAFAANGATPGVDQRQANQERRIDQGIASGELTKREARRLDAQQDRIDRAENRAKADGQVTKAERARLAQRQQNASRDIARQKHDAQERRP